MPICVSMVTLLSKKKKRKRACERHKYQHYLNSSRVVKTINSKIIEPIDSHVIHILRQSRLMQIIQIFLTRIPRTNKQHTIGISNVKLTHNASFLFQLISVTTTHLTSAQEWEQEETIHAFQNEKKTYANKSDVGFFFVLLSLFEKCRKKNFKEWRECTRKNWNNKCANEMNKWGWKESYSLNRPKTNVFINIHCEIGMSVWCLLLLACDCFFFCSFNACQW